MQIVNRLAGCFVMTGAVLFTPIVFAQMATNTADASTQDTLFVAKASTGGLTEIQASKFASTQAQSTEVKRFASMMINDHTQAGEKLSAVAQKDGVAAASSPTPVQQDELQQLQALNGAAFDKAYTAMMLKDHRETIALFKKEAATGQNGDLKSFASETLPTLEHHLTMAEKL